MKRFAIILATLLATHAFAADSIVKEETTPPPAAEAITPDQLQPIITGAKGLPKTGAPATPKKSAENDPQEILTGQDPDPAVG